MVFTSIALSQAHILLMDEPTNHLDMQVRPVLNAANTFQAMPLPLYQMVQTPFKPFVDGCLCRLPGDSRAAATQSHCKSLKLILLVIAVESG